VQGAACEGLDRAPRASHPARRRSQPAPRIPHPALDRDRCSADLRQRLFLSYRAHSIALADAGIAPIRVTGLSSAELSTLRTPRTDDAWHALFKVTVTGADVPVAGRYLASSIALEFHPTFPLDPGRAYTVSFDPARLPDLRDAPIVTTTVRLAAAAHGPSTVVTALYPSSDVWPENLLRFYVHFSAPMSRASAVGVTWWTTQDRK
jgi:hypothetical protein